MAKSDSSSSRAVPTGGNVRDAWRRPLAGGLLVSVAAHAAVLAWAAIEIPGAGPPGPLARIAPPPDRAPIAETAIQVVHIRPPGPVPARSGAPPADAPLAVRRGSVVAPSAAPAPMPRMALPPRRVIATLASASAALALPDAASDHEEKERARAGAERPDRGIILRGEGRESARGGAGGIAGSGLGAAGGSGVTLVGRGGDCITPGSVVPTAVGPGGGWLPNRRVGGPGRGSIGRRDGS